MQHACVVLYTVKPGTADEVIRQAIADLAPTYRYQPGFVAYGLIKTCDDAVIALSVWDLAEQAGAATQVAAAWQRQHVAGLVEGVENHGGDMTFFWDAVAISR